MIRYVDMSDALEVRSCAFWNTVTDRFLDGPDGQVCESLEEVRALASANGYEPERLLRLVPRRRGSGRSPRVARHPPGA